MTKEGVDLVIQDLEVVELQFFTKDNRIYILSDEGEWVELSKEWCNVITN